MHCIFDFNCEKSRPKKIWGDNGTKVADEFKKFCEAEAIPIYSTMSEPNAAFGDRTIRFVKNILYRDMEDYGFKYIQKLSEIVTTLKSGKNSSIDIIPKNARSSDFLSVLYSKPLREYKNLKFKIRDRVRISKYDLLLRKNYKRQYIQAIYGIVGISFGKPPTYKLKDEQDELISGKFYQKVLIKVI